MSSDKAVRAATLYAASAALSKVIGFLMLPLYTRYLSPGDYGILAMLQMIVDVLGLALTAGIAAVVMREYHRGAGAAERGVLLGSALVLEGASAAVGAVVIGGASHWISVVILRDPDAQRLLIIAAANFFLSAIGTSATLFLQFEQRAAEQAAIALGKLVVQLTLNVVGVAVLHWGPAGILLSTAVASALANSIAVALMVRSIGFSASWSVIRSLRRSSVPYQIATTGNFLLTFGERFFLAPRWGAAALGVYSVAYQFGFLLLQLAHQPVAAAWTPERFRAHGQPGVDGAVDHSVGFAVSNFFLLGAATCLGVLAPTAIRVMTTEAFWGAGKIVPVVLLAYVFAAWTVIVKFGLDVTGQARWIAISTWISVAVTLSLYAVLIPPFGGQGAAAATAGGFLVRFVLTLLWANRYQPIVYGWRRALTALAASGLTVTAARMMSSGGMLQQLSIDMLAISVFATISILLMPAEPRMRVAKSIADKWSGGRGRM